MREVVRASQFKKVVKRAEKRGKDLLKLRRVLEVLIAGEALPVAWRDHPLRGEWAGWRDLHIEPDWLLIYRVEGGALHLARTGTHADLFRE